MSQPCNNFTVAIRVKPEPPSPQPGLSFHCPTPQSLVLSPPHSYSQRPKHYSFDHIFLHKSNQQIYSQLLQPHLDTLSDNLNLTVLCYGITGSGKTYTTFGDRERGEVGIAMLCVGDVMRRFGQGEFVVSYMQIYNEQIQDLLDEDRGDRGRGLQIMDDGSGRVHIPDLRRIPVRTPQEVEELIDRGNTARVVCSNNINKVSSRSHAILQVQVTDPSTRITNTITIIDLAGSERHTSTGTTLHKEGANINRSLLALGNCLKGLQTQQQHIPFRDSKLTRILKDDLSGRAHNIMIACVSGNYSQAEETMNTLSYAARAARIRVEPVTNQAPTASCEHCGRVTGSSGAGDGRKRQSGDHGEWVQTAKEVISQQLGALKQELLHALSADLPQPSSFRALFSPSTAPNLAVESLIAQCQANIFESLVISKARTNKQPPLNQQHSSNRQTSVVPQPRLRSISQARKQPPPTPITASESPSELSLPRRMNPDYDTELGQARPSIKGLLMNKILQARRKCIDYSHQNVAVFEVEEEGGGRRGADVWVSEFADELDYCT